jgi:hypothetical protein
MILALVDITGALGEEMARRRFHSNHDARGGRRRPTFRTCVARVTISPSPSRTPLEVRPAPPRGDGPEALTKEPHMRSTSALLALAALCLLGLSTTGMDDVYAQTSTDGSGSTNRAELPQYEWLDGLCLVELDSADELSLRRARTRIEAAGGQIAILSPPATLLGWIPAELRGELIGQARIRAIHDRPLPASELQVADGPTRIMRRYFNRISSGEYQREMRARAEKAPLIDPAQLVSDALPREPADPWAIRDNLERNGFPPDLLEDQGLLRLEKGNSDTMAGTVAVSLFFVESDGTQSDPDLYDWTDDAVQEYIEGVNTGMAWWSSKARLYRDCWAAFLVRWFDPRDPRCSQWREMILHPSGDVAPMVSDVMINFGYTGGNVFSKVDAFNTAQRLSYGADRSYSAFIAYNPIGAGDRLTDGR